MNREEQIEEMAKIIDELYNVYDTTAGDIADGLYNAGYRKEQETAKEIERLKAENNVWSTQINQAYDNGYKDGYDSAQDDIKQAKIDVLNELKNRLVVYYPSVISEIDELIKEIGE